jgi:Flp pilus assembly protein TadD
LALFVAEEKPAAPKLAAALVGLFIVLGVAKSSTRNKVWKNNAALIEQTVEDSPTSAKAHMMMAQLHSDRGQMREALEETALAVTLGPKTDHQLLAFSADMFQMGGKCRTASMLYEKSLKLQPDQPQVRLNAAICLNRMGAFAKARETARGGPASYKSDPRLVRIAQVSDSLLALSVSNPAQKRN